MTKKVIILAGPTASGKTAVSTQLARYFNTAVISADSRQCYREMRIGTAVPDTEEMQDIPHYFIHTHSITDPVSAGTFVEYALEKIALILQKRNAVIICGGTGLYLEALTEGLHDLPQVSVATRTLMSERYRSGGLPYLQAYVAGKDPEYYATVDPLNPARLLRAAELMEQTGDSYSNLLKTKKESRLPYPTEKFVMDWPRAVLYERINERVDRMMAAGLLEEVRSLLPYRNLPTLQTVGYHELFEFLDGKITLETAIKQIKQHTRNYAKRQLTWFRNRGDYTFLSGSAVFDTIVSI